jgi:hypothetical protein
LVEVGDEFDGEGHGDLSFRSILARTDRYVQRNTFGRIVHDPFPAIVGPALMSCPYPQLRSLVVRVLKR